MRNANEIKFNECFVGMEFNYTTFDYDTQSMVKETGTVLSMRETKTGRIKISVSGRGDWTNAAVCPTNYLQEV